MRKVLGISKELHQELAELSKRVNLPMTVVIESLVHHAEIDWGSISAQYELRKPTWSNIKRKVQEYQVKFPGSTDEKLAELTGFSVAQVETITHTAHKRVIQAIRANKRLKSKALSQKCGVSERFASRILDQLAGAKVPKDERYLFEGLI